MDNHQRHIFVVTNSGSGPQTNHFESTDTIRYGSVVACIDNQRMRTVVTDDRSVQTCRSRFHSFRA